MPLPSRHHIKEFRGEHQAANLLDGLKRLKGAATARVVETLRLVQRAEALALCIDTSDGKRNPKAPEFQELESLIKIDGRLDSLLDRCHVRPVVWNWEDGKLEFAFAAVNDRRRTEVDAIWGIVGLAEKGLAGRIRECSHCAKWFFARFEHQRHCPGGDCRVAEIARSEKWRAYRREKSKEYYWLRKTKNVK
jgi:hypothetical protein